MQTLTRIRSENPTLPKIQSSDTFKSLFAMLCDEDNSIPIFMQTWWLNAVCSKGNWEVCLSFDNAGEINGALVYYKVKLRGIVSAIVMPELTPHTGIWLKLPEKSTLKQHSKYTDTKKITEKLIAQIPSVKLYHQKFHHTLIDWQPFFWANYSGQVHYTYTLRLNDPEKIYADMKGSVRTAIKKAEKIVAIVSCENTETLFALCKKSMEKQGTQPQFLLRTLTDLDKVLSERDCRKIFLAQDNDGNAHGAIYMVYDDNNKSAHYLVGGSDPELRKSGAVMLLLWHAIIDAHKRGYTIFDFEGSMVINVENAFRNFGATQTPFFRITKAKNNFWAMLALFFPNYN